MTTTTPSVGFYDADADRSVIGCDDGGTPVWLPWRHTAGVLLSGAPGSEARLLRSLIQGMADSGATVQEIDGKGDDDPWAPLRELAEGITAQAPDLSRPRHVVVIREPAECATDPALRRLLGYGRRARISVVLVAQSDDALPLSVYDGLGVRIDIQGGRFGMHASDGFHVGTTEL